MHGTFVMMLNLYILTIFHFLTVRCFGIRATRQKEVSGTMQRPLLAKT